MIYTGILLFGIMLELLFFLICFIQSVKGNVSSDIHDESPAPEPPYTLNCTVSIDPVYENLFVLSGVGDLVPDIMSKEIMQSDIRTVTEIIGGVETQKIVSGPQIVINDIPVPEHGFYLECDYYSDECYYVICPGCFKSCGFEYNRNLRLTPYDEATLSENHSYTIPVDELELHTTWKIEKYSRETNTYYFKITQNGPFSGTSDVFSTYLNGKRLNTMPKEGTIHGTQYVEYDAGNMYWTTLEYSRNDFRYLIDRKYGTDYGRLSYNGDVPMENVF